MEAVRTQDIGRNDLRWRIDYDEASCTLCGSCVAACTFDAIAADVRRHSLPLSDGPFPAPRTEHRPRPVIRQRADLARACGFASCWYLTPRGFEEGPLPEV